MSHKRSFLRQSKCKSSKIAQSIETIETTVRISTYTRRAGGVRTLGYPFPQGGERLSAACRTGVQQRGAGGTDAKQEQRPRSKATLDPHKLSTQPDESTHARSRRRRGIPTSLQL